MTLEGLFYIGAALAIIARIVWPHLPTVRLPRRAASVSLSPANLPQASVNLPAAPIAPAPPTSPAVLPHATWWRIVTQEAQHLRIIGPTGSGKSVLAQAVAGAFDGQLCVIDPVWVPGNWGGLPAITVSPDGEYSPIDLALKAIITEMKTRGAALQQGQSTFERLTVLFDEVPDTVTELPDSAGILIRRLAQRGRHANIHLIGMGQSDRVKAWGIEGYGDAAQNFATILLGTKALDAMPALIGHVARPAVLEWQGKRLAIDVTGLLELAARPIDVARVWQVPTAAPDAARTPMQQKQIAVARFLDEAETLPSMSAIEKAVWGYKGGKAHDELPEVLRLLADAGHEDAALLLRPHEGFLPVTPRRNAL